MTIDAPRTKTRAEGLNNACDQLVQVGVEQYRLQVNDLVGMLHRSRETVRRA